MTDAAGSGPDWGALWRAGVLPRLCFISLGIMFHAGAENMMSTIMPVIVRDIGGVELNGWSFAIYEIGSIIAGAATGRMCTYWTVRTNMVIAAMIYAAGATATALSPSMEAALVGRLICGFGGGALIALSYVAVQRYVPVGDLAATDGGAGGRVGSRRVCRAALWRARRHHNILALGVRIARDRRGDICSSPLVVLRDEVAPEPAISPGRFPLFALGVPCRRHHRHRCRRGRGATNARSRTRCCRGRRRSSCSLPSTAATEPRGCSRRHCSIPAASSDPATSWLRPWPSPPARSDSMVRCCCRRCMASHR